MVDDKSLMKENLSMPVNVGSVDEHVWYTCNA